MIRTILLPTAIFCAMSFINSHDSSKRWVPAANNFENNMIDTVIRDIPLNKYGEPSFFYKNKPEIEDQLGLVSLEDGYDSLQIRLWFSYAFIDSSQLVTVRNNKNKWSIELVTFLTNYTNDKVVIENKRVIPKYPKSGWQDFTNKLFQLQILTLPDESKIPKYSMFTDADRIVVEIATTKEYRIYQYQGPMIAHDDIWQIKNMGAILKLIENEFSFKRLRRF
ncbi:MAG: hypothetical protein ACRDE5_06160 [Ginsengibacter sp.]